MNELYISNHYIKSINKRIMRHNQQHPGNGLLTFREDKLRGAYDIALGAAPVISGRSIEEAYWIIHSICNYADLQPDGALETEHLPAEKHTEKANDQKMV